MRIQETCTRKNTSQIVYIWARFHRVEEAFIWSKFPPDKRVMIYSRQSESFHNIFGKQMSIYILTVQPAYLVQHHIKGIQKQNTSTIKSTPRKQQNINLTILNSIYCPSGQNFNYILITMCHHVQKLYNNSILNKEMDIQAKSKTLP